MNMEFSGHLPASKLPQVGTTIFTEMSALAAECGALNVAQGFPDMEPPAVLRRAVARAMEDGANQYAPMAGNVRLREWIAEDLFERTGTGYDPGREITIGAGASSVLFAAIMALVSEGDEVIIMEPAYDLYAPVVRLAGGTVRRLERRFPDYGLDFEGLRTVLSRHTRMVVVNSPHNPTGVTWTRDDLEALHRCLDGSDAVVLSDEVYGPIVHDGREALSAAHHPDLAQRSLIAGSFGKVLHATGWKIGWLAGAAELMAEVRKVHQYDVFSTGAPFQAGIAEFLSNWEGQTHLAKLAESYTLLRNRLCEGLRDTAWSFTPAEGGYFQVLDYGAFHTEPDQETVRAWTRAPQGIATIPLSSFYDPSHPLRSTSTRVRVCFAKQPDTLDQAIDRLRKLAGA